MADGQLSPIVRYIRKLAGPPNARQVADRELLSSFLTNQSDEAFAVLVKRHGPMVMGVCRRLLQNGHDAEDAFQATFLVLVRKARGIRKGDSLGSWLHGVAYRVASEARGNDARRRIHERQVKAMATTNATSEVEERDLRAVLDEELERLPEKHRAPLVLCYLEGKTTDEVAHELGLLRGTVASRLARARQALRTRLVRRGLGLSAIALAALLPKSGASAAVPPMLLHATVKAAILTATGHAAAGAVSAKVAALTQGAMKAMLATKLKVAMAVLTAVCVIGTGVGTATHRLLAQPGLQSKQETPPANKLSRLSAPAQAVVTHADNANEKEHAVDGVVRDAAGKPIPGATILWTGNVKPKLAVAGPASQSRSVRARLLVRGIADDGGRFSLKARFDADDFYLTQLIVKAAATGFAGQMVPKGRTTLDIQVPVELKIEGRLQTLQGLPAKGVEVRLTRLTGIQGFDPINAWGIPDLLEQDGKEQGCPHWPKPTRTDDQGRFRLDGLVQGASAELEIKHPDFATEILDVAVSGLFGTTVSRSFGSNQVQRSVEPKFTRTLEPGRAVQGTVTSVDTGKPLADVFVRCAVSGSWVSARTDFEGHYRIDGLSGRRDNFGRVYYYPEAASGYLPAQKEFRGWAGASTSAELHVRLRKGHVIHGQALDAVTGKPIHGAAIAYTPETGNPNIRNDTNYNPALTDPEGRFSVMGLRGKGLLMVDGPDPNYIRILAPPKGYGAIRPRAPLPHAIASLNLADGTDAPVSVTLRKGVVIEAKAVKPDGGKLPWINFICPDVGMGLSELWNKPQQLPDGLLRLYGCDPEHRYKVYILQPVQRLGAVAELKYDPNANGPIEIRLQPTASVHGKVILADGSPAVKVRMSPMLEISKKEGKRRFLDFVLEQGVVMHMGLEGVMGMMSKVKSQQTGKNGEFHFTNLLPGTKLYLFAAKDMNEEAHPEVVFQPGEDKNAGTIRLVREP